MLARGDVAGLATDIMAYNGASNDPASARLEETRRWLLPRSEEGRGSAGLAALLAKVSNETNRTDEAVRWITYSRVVTFVDAGSCDDPTAPRGKLQNLMTNFQDLDQAIRRLPVPQRIAVIDSALSMEARTWPLRQTEPSGWLCSGGSHEMLASLARGVQGTPQPASPSGSRYGRQLELPRDPNYRPNFRSAAAWTENRAMRLLAVRNIFLQRAGVDPARAAAP